MKHNVNYLLLFLILASLFTNVLFLFWFDGEVKSMGVKVSVLNMSYAGNLTACNQDRQAYRDRLLDVSTNCARYVYRKENETSSIFRSWAESYVINITKENMAYRERLLECTQHVIQLREEVCA